MLILRAINFLNLSEAAMSTVIGNYDTNKQWAMVGVVLYSKNDVQTNEVTDFLYLEVENTYSKRSNRFHEHTLAESKRCRVSRVFFFFNKVIQK